MKRDGSLEHCPVCRATLPVPKDVCGQSRCPRCSCWLWHLNLSSGSTFFVQRAGESIYDLLAEVVGARHGLTAADLERTLREADSLDVAELLAELENAV
jgi:hypothetical protein